jgi:membrane protein YqaA with SNARE-associated domain
LKRLAALSVKYRALLLGFLKPLGFWGVGAVAVLDSSSIPVPMDLIVAGYAWSDAHRFYLYVLMASIGSAIGGLVPYWIGRAGGEIFLMKRIDRVRYEKMRDKFERQEFMAIMIPAMMPPPMPIKLFEFGAGVFEMKPLLFALAIFLGKFIQFLVCALITIFYGPEIAHTARHAVHEHPAVVIGIALAAALLFVVYVLRKSFDKRRGADDTPEATETTADDPTLIT